MSYKLLNCKLLGHQEETRNVHAQMQSPMVQTILNTGVDRDRVRNVIERRIRDTGKWASVINFQSINISLINDADINRCVRRL